jgi:hypothetical protein
VNELRQRHPRMVDGGFLAWLRKRRCAFCGKHPPTQAAHIRMAHLEIGKRETGKQEKPDDKWALPLCQWCHLDGPESQHKIGEEKFWGLAEINPFELAQKLYVEYGGTGGKPQRPRTTIKPRLPKEKRAKIQQRKATWPSRPLRNRSPRS